MQRYALFMVCLQNDSFALSPSFLRELHPPLTDGTFHEQIGRQTLQRRGLCIHLFVAYINTRKNSKVAE